ncbi:MAG: RidA family protein [Calditrichaeota bacterium]|nr:RidA family protein [Calditrichota bacterium]
MAKREVVSTGEAPAAIGPYSQGVVVSGELVFTAGQIAIDPATGEMVGSTVEEQTRRVLLNLKAVLEAAGSALERVVKTTVYLRSMDDFQAMNAVYSEFFGVAPPARSAVEVARLPKDALVEIEAVALVD